MAMSFRLITFLIASIGAALVINTFGYGLAHSAFLGLATFILSPGILVFFFSERLGSAASWGVLILVDVIYYELVYRATKWSRRERS